LTHRVLLTALTALALIGCQQEATFEGQETVPGVIQIEAEPVDLDVLSAWTATDAYTAGDFIDAQAIVLNQGDYAATFTVTLTMIIETGASAGDVEGEYEMDTLYTVEPGEEVEIFEGIQAGTLASGTCSWQVRVKVADEHREDTDRSNNKASSNVFQVGS
jgi:hypothetical protein